MQTTHTLTDFLRTGFLGGYMVFLGADMEFHGFLGCYTGFLDGYTGFLGGNMKSCDKNADYTGK